MGDSDSGVLAERLLRAEFRRLASGDPQQALDMVQRVVLAMHWEAMKATEVALRAGVA